MKLTISLAAGALIMALSSTAMAGTVLVKNMAPRKYGHLVVYYKNGDIDGHTHQLGYGEGERLHVADVIPTKLVWMKEGKPVFSKDIPEMGQAKCAVSAISHKDMKLIFTRDADGRASCSHPIAIEESA